MYYYEVLVATKSKIDQYLTYVSADELDLYQVVQVPVRKQIFKGLIMKSATIDEELTKKCRPISLASPFKLPKTLVRASLDLYKQSALSLSAVANLLLSNVPVKIISKPNIDYKYNTQTTLHFTLTPAQQKIYNELQKYKDNKPRLLLGVNGAGKTFIYAQLIKDQLKNNKSTLVLVPEIGLSVQVLELLQRYLSDINLYLFHSQLTPKQRKSLWQLCCQNKNAMVVIGPRSAEFLPFYDLGLIIIDEFHDDSFQQTTQPSYQGLRFSQCLMDAYGAKLVCGSATPRIEDYYNFQQANYPILHLKEKALTNIAKPEIVIIDKATTSAIFHPQTLQILINSLRDKHQVLIFYNRRGHWRVIRCQQCQWQAECRNCQNTLVFHQDKFTLACHKCGQQTKPLSVCPQCKTGIEYSFAGIKSIVNELQKQLSQFNLKTDIWRFDSDNPKHETLAHRLAEINSKQDLIIIGTQVINQGLDLVNLQTVLVLDAEQSLTSPDYRTNEKWYNQIHQIAGRVGRGHLQKTYVILQTNQPQQKLLQQAVNQDWLNFYEDEIKERQKYNLPPYVHLANIIIRRSTDRLAQKTALKLYRDLCLKYTKITFYPPVQHFYSKYKNQYEWLIHASSPNRNHLLYLANKLKDKNCFINLDINHLFET